MADPWPALTSKLKFPDMKNKTSNYLYLGDASIRAGHTTLRPWPDFAATGEIRKEADRIVCDLLESDDPLAHLWRAKIPDAVLGMIRTFPRCLWRALLETSQLHPRYFLQWGGDCPALVALLALHSTERQNDRDLDRMRAFYNDRTQRMQILGLPPTRQAYHILSKLPAAECYPVQLRQLREAIGDKSRRRLMSHLKTITTETLDTLQLPAEYLDVHLLGLRRCDQVPAQCGSVAELCREIAHFRQVRGKLPHWPYRGKKVILNQLVQARNALEVELALGDDCKTVRFPKPPLEAIASSKLKVEPLTSVRELFHEGNQMDNCITTYARSILNGRHYAYRMTHPVRATILLIRNTDTWYPVEIRAPGNKYAPQECVDLVYKWTGTAPVGKETLHDYPF